MNIGEINGVQVAVSPEAYEKIRKQKIIEENNILKEQQQELDKYKNIVDKTNWWLEEMLKQAKSEETKAIINGTLDLLLKGE